MNVECCQNCVVGQVAQERGAGQTLLLDAFGFL